MVKAHTPHYAVDLCELGKGPARPGCRLPALSCTRPNVARIRAGLLKGLCESCPNLVVTMGKRLGQEKAASASARTVRPTPQVLAKVSPLIIALHVHGLLVSCLHYFPFPFLLSNLLLFPLVLLSLPISLLHYTLLCSVDYHRL